MALILRNGGSQSPDRWLRELRNNHNRKEEFDNTNEYLIKMNLEADCLKVQFISDASTKELKMMIERLAPVEVGLMVKTWGNGGFLEVDFKESQAIISNK